MSSISRRAQAIRPSATLALTARAAEMRAAGRPVISFAVGEPDFTSPEPVLAAARKAISEGRTKYTPAAGIPELRSAIADELARLTGARRSASEVIVSNGAKQVLFNLLQALINPGDRVAFAAPYWVSYPTLVELADGRSLIIPTEAESGFRINLADFTKALDEHRPKVFILNTPQNPTGAVYPAADVDALIEACLARDIYVISDEIYSCLVFGDAVHRSALAIDDPKRRRLIIWVHGVSKSLAMTGWRIGYAVGPAEVIAAATRIQSHATSSPATVSQYAALGGLRAGPADTNAMRDAFAVRRAEIIRLIAEIPGLTMRAPEGAFYAFPSVKSLIPGRIGGKVIHSDLDLAEQLLDQAEIAIVPGSAFGAPGFLRFSYALGLDDIREGFARLRRALATWTPL